MYNLITDTSIEEYINDLDLLPDHHLCKIKNDNSTFIIAYRDSRDNKDLLFFDNIANNEQSDIFLSRYDDLDCLRYDDLDLIRF